MQEMWIKKVKKIKVLKIFIYLDSVDIADNYHGSFSPIHKRFLNVNDARHLFCTGENFLRTVRFPADLYLLGQYYSNHMARHNIKKLPSCNTVV